MNNWRLLLVAVVVVVLPAGSFTESNLIDGSENCESSADVRLARKTEKRCELNGNQNRRQDKEERRLSSRNPDRRYETRFGSMLTRSERNLDHSERHHSREISESIFQGFTREKENRHRVTDQIREIRKDQDHDESRTLVQNERNSLQSRIGDTLDTSRIIRNLRDDSRRFSNERESRNSMSRIPIRTSRRSEERMESPGRETTSQWEREDLTGSDSRRRLTKFSASSQFESRIQLDNRAKQSQAAGNIHEHDAKHKKARFSERENRNSRYMQMQRQRSIDLSIRVGTNQPVSVRTGANRRYESRDNARINRLNVRNNENNERPHKNEIRFTDTQQNSEERVMSLQQTRASGIEITKKGEHLERLQLSMDTLPMLRQSRDRLSRDSERNSRNIRAARFRDIRHESSEKRRLQRVNRKAINTIMPTIRQTIDNAEQMVRQTARRDVRESLVERRQDNRVSQERATSADRIESRRMTSLRVQRETSDERKRDNIEKTTYRKKQEAGGNNEKDKFGRSTSLSQLRLKSHNVVSTSRPEKSDLRRQVLERSITSSEQRESRDIKRASRSVESLRNRDDTKAFERDDRGETRDQDRLMEHHNVATSQQVDTHRSSRIESNRLDRIVRSRYVRENEKRETQRDDDRSRMMNRRSKERVLRQQKREAASALEERSQDRVIIERRHHNKRKSSIVRAESRNSVEVRNERVLDERKTEIRNRETARDIRGEIRSRGEVRREKNLEKRRHEARGRERNPDERKQENREHVREETGREQIRSPSGSKMNERIDSRRQGAREIKITERLAQRTSDRNGLHRESKNQRSRVVESTYQLPSRLIRDVKREEFGFGNVDVAFYRNTMETDKSDSVFSNWQMILYTLQGIYVCGLIMQMITERSNQTTKRTNYWSSPKNLIKVD